MAEPGVRLRAAGAVVPRKSYPVYRLSPPDLLEDRSDFILGGG